MVEAVAEEYRSSLLDLNFNSKPHINMLTMLAEENVKFAPMIVDTIVTHINTVRPDLKLPSLYLVDSIMKNIGGQYITLFSKHMITLFSSVFEKVEETTRSALYKLRQTWNDILPKNILYGVDRKVSTIDPAWPITAQLASPVSSASSKNPIHVNPKFLGGPATQSPSAVKNPEKPAVKTNEAPKEVIDIKKKQEEMLRLIDEKKVQLKALQQRKMEMAAKQKKKVTSLQAPVVPQQTVQKKSINHRDPRLKKGNAIPQTPASIKGTNKPSIIPLQSIVVVPNINSPLDVVPNSNGNEATKLSTKIKDEKLNVPTTDSTFIAQEQTVLHKKVVKNIDKNRDIHKDKHNASGEPLNRNYKVIKKHSMSPDNKLGANAKRFCKQPAAKLKRPHAPGDNLQPLKDNSPPIKKEKNEYVKSRNKLDVRVCSSPEGRLSEALLFGTEDKDYRHQVRLEDRVQSNQWHHVGNTQIPISRVSQDVFNPNEHNTAELPASATEGKLYSHENITEHNSALKQPCDETYINKPLETVNQIKHSGKLKDVRNVEAGTFNHKENQDINYTSKPVVAKERLLPPLTTSIVLDGKNRTIHYVDDRALTVMDNNEPREVTFAGTPRNVYVEGLPHPLQVEFGGRQIDFITEGKRNVLRFGTPSREIYINNFPYEAKFGGPHFTALLEDKKEHKIRIDGPPPQVVISEQPAYELYENFNRNKNILQQPLTIVQNIKKEPEDTTLLQDVDMRVKPSHILKSSILPQSKKDIDWRHVSSSDPSHIPWKNSFETYNDVSGARNFTAGVSSISTQLDYNNSSSGNQSDNFFPERNNNMNHVTWPHPGYREVMPSNERPAFDPPPRMDQQPQHAVSKSWEIQTSSTLPPPPSIPLSLNLSTQTNLSLQNLTGPPPLPNLQSLTQLPNLSVPPPSWNPLPPPPMFTGAVPDSSNLASSSVCSNTNPTSESAVSLPTLPVNVETIYEKLVAAGIITKKPEDPPSSKSETTGNDEKVAEETKDVEEEIEIPEIRLTPKSLRQFNPAVIAALYRGSQCATCGMRFKEIQSEQYSRHLDWHFRMNRREKDGAKKAYSRRLYYEVKDWIQFKEIEEAEERTPSYFELQADGDMSRNEEKEKIQSVPASECESEKCSVCGEQFQLFWIEEEEEWHLRNAVRHDGEAYHPMCYEDHKKATELANREPEVSEENPSNSVKEETEEKMDVNETTPTTTDIKEKVKVEAIKEESPNEDKAVPETSSESVEVEISEIPTTDTLVEDKIPEGSTVSIKEEKVDGPSETKAITEETECGPSSDTEMKTEKVEMDISSVGSELEESKPVVKIENPTKTSVVPEDKKVNLNSDEDSENFVEEFRPPTPDPRFEVLPPVFKGTELSALCTIM